MSIGNNQVENSGAEAISKIITKCKALEQLQLGK